MGPLRVNKKTLIMRPICLLTHYKTKDKSYNMLLGHSNKVWVR